MLRIESIIDFPFYIPCSFNLLGQDFEIKICSFKGIISFPCLPLKYFDKFGEIPNNGDLTQPIGTAKKFIYNDKVEWGTCDNKEGNSLVKSCSIAFSVKKMITSLMPKKFLMS